MTLYLKILIPIPGDITNSDVNNTATEKEEICVSSIRSIFTAFCPQKHKCIFNYQMANNSC